MNLTGIKSLAMAWLLLWGRKRLVQRNANELVRNIRPVVVWTTIQQQVMTKSAGLTQRPGEVRLDIILHLAMSTTTTTASDQVDILPANFTFQIPNMHSNIPSFVSVVISYIYQYPTRLPPLLLGYMMWVKSISSMKSMNTVKRKLCPLLS